MILIVMMKIGLTNLSLIYLLNESRESYRDDNFESCTFLRSFNSDSFSET